MGTNIPGKPTVDQIKWFEARLPDWSSDPTGLGLSPTQVASLETAVQQARAAYDAAQNARVASKNATVEERFAVSAMLGLGRPVVNAIKAFIETSGNESLWAQAGLSPADPPSVAPAPLPPYEMSASLDTVGNLILRWKTSQPSGVFGVIYSVQRSLDDGPFVLLDSVGEKEFVDMTVPLGTQSVSYTIRAKRGQQVSAWSPAYTVRFGRSLTSGALTITGTERAAA